MGTEKRFLTTEDLAWVSIKINSHYAMVKKSDVMTDEEKQVEINMLMERAMRFKLYESVHRMGFMIIEISLQNKEPAILIIPRNYNGNDIEMVNRYLELHFESYQFLN